jgi:DNA-binding MarR family transcriptional regulator
MEVIATFYEATHARDYVRLQGPPAERQQDERQPVVKQTSKGKPRQVGAAKFQPAARTGRKQPSAANSKPAAKATAKQAAPLQRKSAPAAELAKGGDGMSDRQIAVLKALRSLKDKKNRVEAKAIDLAKASSVPLGSLHSILVSLEKKHMIRTERRGTPKFSAIYEVLETSQKTTRALNGVVHG